jgi:hypothetical protein
MLFALPSAARAQTSSAGGVTGRVVDTKSGAPLADAVVRLVRTPYDTRTDADGRFTLHVPPGQYTAVVDHPAHEPATEIWWLGSELLSITVALEPREFALDTVRASSRDPRDLSIRVKTWSGEAPIVWDEEALENSGSGSVAEFLIRQLRLVRTPCRSSSTAPLMFDAWRDDFDECVRIRGSVRNVCVAMDDAALPGGLAVLANYRPADLARISAFRGGEFVLIYTKQFFHNAKYYRFRPLPPAAQMAAFCPVNPPRP